MSFNEIFIDKKVCDDNKDTPCNVVIDNNKITNSSQIPSHKKKEQTGKDDIVNISIKSCKNITSKQALLIIPITKYFSNKKTLKKLITILKGESISLRLIDWFVTNYCKKFNVIYNLNDFKEQPTQPTQSTQSTQSQTIPAPNIQSFDSFILVHNNYKGQLKAYSKKNFDPFCRRNRIRFYYDDNKYFITTVGQLNFFKWALENYIINYIQSHMKDIENDMNLRCEIVKKVSAKIKKQDGCETTIINEPKIKKAGITTRKKRKEISNAASKTLSIHNFPMTIEFD
jgi:hypothetical protein